MAICRLKRVAADYKGDMRARMPTPPAGRNGKHIACVGAGPASLTVARDLVLAGYAVSVYDAEAKAGGFIRSQIPKFRLPESVIDEEVGYILDLGVRTEFGRRVESLQGAARRRVMTRVRRLRRAARARAADSPAARRRPRKSISGSTGCFRLVSATSRRSAGACIVLGGGNTAMDCCRSARRLGGADVRSWCASGFEEMKASPWEKEDAMREDIPILNYPRAEGIRARQRPADRHDVREGACRIRRARAAASWCRPASRPCSWNATTCWSRSGRKTLSPGSSATSALTFDRMGHAGASTR